MSFFGEREICTILVLILAVGSDKFVVAEGNMAVAVINGCEKLNLRGENYKFLLLCFRCGEIADISKTAEALSVEIN